MNNRRKLMVALGASGLAAPFASLAQKQGKVWRLGFLGPASAGSMATVVEALRAGLHELGYIEGKNLITEFRWADSKYDRFPDLVGELVRLRVDVIVAAGPQATSAAQKSTITIPIVMANSDDPVGSGFVKSLSRPGGNITGLSNMTGDFSPKQLEMLLAMVPKLSRVAVLVNPSNASNLSVLKSFQSAAQKTRAEILPVEARTAQDIEPAFAAMTKEKAGAIIVVQDGLFLQQRAQIVELAVKHRLPTIFRIPGYVVAGGLMSYGPNSTENFRRAATFVDKILKGAKPADLPVEQPMRFELVINGKTAKALGLTIPQELLIMADKVIE